MSEREPTGRHRLVAIPDEEIPVVSPPGKRQPDLMAVLVAVVLGGGGVAYHKYGEQPAAGVPLELLQRIQKLEERESAAELESARINSRVDEKLAEIARRLGNMEAKIDRLNDASSSASRRTR